MSGEKRRDLRRWLTAALAVSTVALVYYHFATRERALAKARSDVGYVQGLIADQIADQVIDLKNGLASWRPGTALPVDIDNILTGEGKADPAMQPVDIVREGLLHHFWVHTISSDTSQVLEGPEVVLRGDGTPYSSALDFTGDGTATLVVTASLVDPPAPGSPPLELGVLLQRGPAAETLDQRPFLVKESDPPTSRVFTFPVNSDFRRTRHDLVLRIAPDAPAVKVSWNATIGKVQGPQLVVGVLRPAESVFLRGYVPLEKITKNLKVPAPFEPLALGDRFYLTDASGTVVQAVPEYPEKIRKRVKGGERKTLSSAATQRIKIQNGDTEEYEGFVKGDRVVGAFGPLAAVDGGLIVEREEKAVLASWRGVQPWHLSAVLFGLLLLYPLVPPVVRKIRDDTELPRLLAYAKPFLPHIAAIVGAAALCAAGIGIFGYQTKVVTDEVLVNPEGGAYDRLHSICWFLSVVAVGMFAANWVKEYLAKFIQNRLVVEIRCVLCEKIAHLPMSFHSRQRAGDLLSRIQNDVAETNRGLEMLFGDVISDPITIVGCIATTFVINWRLALVVFVGMPVILVPVSYFGKSIKKYARRRQAKRADVTHTINQMLSGIRVVKAFRMEDHEARRIRSVSERFLVEAMKVARAQVTGKEFLDFFNNVSTILITGLGGYLILERQVTLGDLSAFGLVIARMYRSAKSLATNYNKMQESLAGTERVFEIIDTPDTMMDRSTARALVRPRQEIAFEGVSFRYGDDAPWVLRKLSFRVPVGTSVALVGATGAGKSTILDLVARFYDPQEGRITVDGVDLRDYSRDSLLAQVAVVTQEPFLFNATIAENLSYGRPGASPTEVEGAARAAFIHEEILRQSDGYQTVVGERGSRLSGGQRQRVTIARAILKDPPILLLDEATSALDSRAEQKVQEALYGLMKDRTTFVIAHRLSTIQGVDKILVLEGGCIVESGTHEELLRIPDGHYRRLYEIQFAAALKQEEPGASAAG